ncbi:hypothetical protein TNCV_4192521 [Trichonephila clavipes]|nr:hypothetical protein TNCV_4192521 [Trichonephila clavipes]
MRASVLVCTIERRLTEGQLPSRFPLRVYPPTLTHRHLRLRWCHAQKDMTAIEWNQVNMGQMTFNYPSILSAVRFSVSGKHIWHPPSHTRCRYQRAFGDGSRNLNHGQVIWTTPELAPPSPNSHMTSMGGRFILSEDLMCMAALHEGSLVVLGSKSLHVCHMIRYLDHCTTAAH